MGLELELESMSIEMPEVASHPNRVGFRGVLTYVDVASDAAPSGAKGHCVMLRREATERALPSLLGMALDYAPQLDRHDARRKVGVITQADLQKVEGRWSMDEVKPHAVSISGFLYGRDFPELVREMRAKGPAVLGMSYEITDARIDDVAANVWQVTDFTFTGAAVLRRDKAAYRGTWIEVQ
mgnify:CR=1 FL=1